MRHYIMKKNSLDFKYLFPIPCAFPIPTCDSLPIPKEKQKLVCNEICGNFLLNDNPTFLEVWEKRIEQPVTATVTVFNSLQSSLIEVCVQQSMSKSILFIVPPGNSISKTIEDTQSVTIRLLEPGSASGKFCLDIHFAIKSL
ncbi:S-Ena type endospore appendage [Bacillus sp. JJ689]|uniref:S-Ena type endospore appendage n=1 Tax=Bacillus sp. JJ689 TaxID=3122949 RepID=UPI002FFDDD09